MTFNMTGKSFMTVFLVVTFGIVFGLASPAHAQLSGAIFTTDSTGSTVNGNIYSNKDDVYLNGGPQPNAPCTASGLPDGDYYFQVTDPSGAVLLSTDDILSRQVTVFGGLITGASNHSTGTGKCASQVPGNISVQLSPYNDTPNQGGEYKVWITPTDKYVADDTSGSTSFGFQPQWSKTDNFKVITSNPPAGSTISGAKFYDADLSGTQNNAEAGIPNWVINIAGPDGFASYMTTTALGYYSFMNLDPGTYGVCEVIPLGGVTWVPTTPTGISGITVPPDSTNNKFGNVCLGYGGGLTLGFWSNKNGQSLTTASMLCTLNSLNLRNGTGANYDPIAGCATAPTAAQLSSAKTSFRSWLLSANATNMAYMLSAQFAAMELNVMSGGVAGNAMVYAGPSDCLSPADGLTATGFISVNNLMNAANTQLGLNGLTKAGSPNRPCQEYIKNALDAGNNNLNFVQSSACAVVYGNTETCTPVP